MISKSFRFNDEDLRLLAEVKASLGIQKDIDVIRKLLRDKLIDPNIKNVDGAWIDTKPNI